MGRLQNIPQLRYLQQFVVLFLLMQGKKHYDTSMINIEVIVGYILVLNSNPISESRYFASLDPN